MYLNHITMTTGHIARTSRADVAQAVTALLAEWLPTTINSGKAHSLPVVALSHFSAQVFVQDGALVVTVSAPAGHHQPGKPHTGKAMPLVTFGVAQRSRQASPMWEMMVKAFGCKSGLKPPDTPLCAVAIHPGIAIYKGPAKWLGDFERCVAWVWITRNPDLKPV